MVELLYLGSAADLRLIESQIIIMVLVYTDSINHIPSNCNEYLHVFSILTRELCLGSDSVYLF